MGRRGKEGEGGRAEWADEYGEEMGREGEANRIGDGKGQEEG